MGSVHLDGSNIVKEFVQSGKKEMITKAKLGDGRALRSLRKLDLDPVRNTEVKVRLVRVELDDGEIEVLMTSLVDRVKYPASIFKWLYGKRWGGGNLHSRFEILPSTRPSFCLHPTRCRAGLMGQFRIL